MRGVLGFLGVIVVAAVGLAVYRSYVGGTNGTTTAGGNNPRAVVDIVGVKTDLIAIAHGERDFQALNGRYATLDELKERLQFDPARGRDGYKYSSEACDRTAPCFTIVAAYSGAAMGMPVFSIDETMQVAER